MRVPKLGCAEGIMTCVAVLFKKLGDTIGFLQGNVIINRKKSLKRRASQSRKS